MVGFVLIILALAGKLVNGNENQQQNDLSALTSEFFQRLYQKVSLNTSNIVYSPFSIHSVLTLASLGAKGKTNKEISKTLGIKSKVYTLYKSLFNEYKSIEQAILNTFNAIFVKPEIKIIPKFTKKAETNFCALIKNLDLSAPEGPEKAINDYIAEATKNTIESPLPQGTISPDTSMLLVNTIFFNGTWENKIREAKNRKFLEHGKTAKMIPMMVETMDIQYKFDKTNEVDVAELPFEGKRFALYIALPRKVDGIASLEQSLSVPNQTDQLFTGLSEETVFVKIPKFTTETTLDLKQPLIELGMVEAFGPGADFSSLTSGGNIFISEVIHKARIEICETGVTAAGATVLKIDFRSKRIPADVKFEADHPFLYFLKDKQSGIILFQGKFSG
ncbi:serpin B4-like [Physella acuta]|uniref:serpin B4-like n=1 Tax=Physella acuta TaxID=109671 RepID=UPI0027DE715A|nr:serpin B4-like [Physella acuta]